jgi:hypothetical protein
MKIFHLVILGIHISTALFAGVYSIIGFSLNRKYLLSKTLEDKKKYNTKYLNLTRLMIYLSIVFAVSGMTLAIRQYGFWILFKIALFGSLVSLEFAAGLKNLEIRDDEVSHPDLIEKASKKIKLYTTGHLIVVGLLYLIAIIKPLK